MNLTLGPDELSVNNSKAIPLIHSNRSACTKGPWYEVLHPMYSLQLVRDRQEHAHRRKTWDRGFNSRGDGRLLAILDVLG